MPSANLKVLVKVLPHGEGLPLPRYATDGAAGCDLHAAIDEPLSLAPGERAAVPTGLVLAIPEGFEGQVR
ncbi:MAG TPA: dUTP diphosphatase, partial [Thermoanaerobaculia bacterium]|nr:dUTP diphosphatase [Thermoanaerobaculia bacterium]